MFRCEVRGAFPPEELCGAQHRGLAVAVLDSAAVWLPTDPRALRAPGYRLGETQVPIVSNKYITILLESKRNHLWASALSTIFVFLTFLYCYSSRIRSTKQM